MSEAYARQTGMLVRKPNKKELKPAMAAVAVIRDRLRSGAPSEACRRRRLQAMGQTLDADRILRIVLAECVCGVVAHASAACVG